MLVVIRKKLAQYIRSSSMGGGSGGSVFDDADVVTSGASITEMVVRVDKNWISQIRVLYSNGTLRVHVYIALCA